MPSRGEQTGNLVTFVYAAEAKEIPHYTFLDVSEFLEMHFLLLELFLGYL